MSARALEKALARAGVPEGRDGRYMTSARSMFAALAIRAMRTKAKPGTPEFDELTGNAHSFVATMWTRLSQRNFQTMMPIFNGMSASVTANGGMTLRRGQAHIGGPEIMPSTCQDMPAIRSRTVDLEKVGELGRVTIEAAIASLAGRIPADIVLRAKQLQPKQIWYGAGLEVVIDGVANTMVSWGCTELVHQHIDDRVSKAADIPDKIDKAGKAREQLLTSKPKAEQELAEMVPDGLPIRLSIGRNVSGATWQGNSVVTIIMHGYGPGGMPVTSSICRAGYDNIDKPLEAVIVKIYHQRELHRVYGPTPGSWKQGWTLDLVTARMLAASPTGATTIAQAIHHGEATDACGMTVRISAPGVLNGKGRISPEAIWKCGEVRITGVDLPQTLLSAAIGRPIETVVACEELKGAGEIRRAWNDSIYNEPRTSFKLEPARVTVIKATEGENSWTGAICSSA